MWQARWQRIARTILTGRAPRPATVVAGLLAASLLLGSGTAAMAEARNPDLTAQDRADLDRVNASLNAVTTLKAQFVQFTSAGSSATGRLWLKKPGRLRFEYDPPLQVQIISDGTLIYVEDRELETVNSYPLSSTPLKLLVKDRIDLARDADIVSIGRREDQLFIVAREDEGLVQGQLTMIFDRADMELVQWIALDPQGIETSVTLRDVEKGGRIRNSLFEPTEYDWQSDD